MKSLEKGKDKIQKICDKLRHETLEPAEKEKQNPQINWAELQETVFNSAEFQNTIWNPFKEMLKQKYSQLGPEWNSLFLKKLEDQLFSIKS